MLYIDLARLKNDCEEIYSEIGRTFYRMNSGRWPKEGETVQYSALRGCWPRWT